MRRSPPHAGKQLRASPLPGRGGTLGLIAGHAPSAPSA